MPRYICDYCHKSRNSRKGLTLHLNRSRDCRNRHEKRTGTAPDFIHYSTFAGHAPSSYPPLGPSDPSDPWEDADFTAFELANIRLDDNPFGDTTIAGTMPHQQPSGPPEIVKFPAHHEAGKKYGSCETQFETILKAETEQGLGEYGEFEDEDDWKLAEWLVKNVGKNQIDEFLKLNIVRGIL